MAIMWIAISNDEKLKYYVDAVLSIIIIDIII